MFSTYVSLLVNMGTYTLRCTYFPLCFSVNIICVDLIWLIMMQCMLFSRSPQPWICQISILNICKGLLNYRLECILWASLVAQRLKLLPPMQETRLRFLGPEDPLEKEMATHSSILAWRIPWTEDPGRLQSTGSQYSFVSLVIFVN